jgi:hypothetical protein
MHCVVTQHIAFTRISKVKSKSKAVPVHAMEAVGGEEVSCYSFTTSALDGGVVSVTPRPRSFPGERTPGTHCTGG